MLYEKVWKLLAFQKNFCSLCQKCQVLSLLFCQRIPWITLKCSFKRYLRQQLTSCRYWILKIFGRKKKGGGGKCAYNCASKESHCFSEVICNKKGTFISFGNKVFLKICLKSWDILVNYSCKLFKSTWFLSVFKSERFVHWDL